MSAEKTCPNCGQTLPEKGASDASRVRNVWPKVQAAAQQYGREWKVLTPKRMTSMIARLREHPSCTEDILWQAVHGAMAYWRRQGSGHGEFNAVANLVPETLYRPANFEKYLEAYVEKPCAAPAKSELVQRRSAPPSAEPVLSREEGVRRSAEIVAGLTRSITARRASAQLGRGER